MLTYHYIKFGRCIYLKITPIEGIEFSGVIVRWGCWKHEVNSPKYWNHYLTENPLKK